MEERENIIFDININSIQDLYSILLKKWYDFVTLEPQENEVLVKFRKDTKVVDERFIKYSIYSEIVIRAKTISNLDVWITKEEQQWAWEIEFDGNKYDSLAKVVPWNFWEKLFLKLKIKEQKAKNKNAPQKIELWKIVWFFGVILVILLIVWWSYLTFIVMNAKTIDDVRFFTSLWIDLKQINTFIAQLVRYFFSALLLVLTTFWIIFIFKFLVTKKIFKRKKTTYWILAFLFFILTFFSWTAWMFAERKIQELPEWDKEQYWSFLVIDKDILSSWNLDFQNMVETNNLQYYDVEWWDLSDLVWPVTLNFDISKLIQKELKSWDKLRTVSWNFWNGISQIKTDSWLLTQEFTESGRYEVKITLEIDNLIWETRTKELTKLPVINVSNIVKITSSELKSWARRYVLNATSLEKKWKLEWYKYKDWAWSSEPISTKNIFQTEPIFEEEIIWLLISDWEKDNRLDKIFVLSWQQEAQLSWQISYTRSLENEKDFTFYVSDLKIWEWNWYVEEYKWTIDLREYILSNNVTWENPEEESKVSHTFVTNWTYDVSVDMKLSSWVVKKLKLELNVIDELKISEPIVFSVNWEKLWITEVKHNKNLQEYVLNDFWVPSTLNMDARYVKSTKNTYSLSWVTWDFDSDWTIDETSRQTSYNLFKEWRKEITVKFSFVNIKNPSDKVEVTEKIYIEWIKKAYNIDFVIKQDTEYAPAIIWFDASKSYVTDENISKFIWNFGNWDWNLESDAVISWIRYLTAWEYDVSLTVVTTNWAKYSTSKKMVLKPKAQKVKITSSMRSAPVYQWIDFSSSESVWDIVSYLWDFGDGEVSTEANPTHSYKTAGEYTVKLTVDFRNKVVMSDAVKITITN